MKNMMRRTVAFMLMACLLLSVMAPAASAVAVNEPDATTGAISYSWANTVAGESLATATVGKTYGNFAAHGRVKANVNQFQTTSFATGTFFLLKFSIATAGYYNIALDIAEARTSTTEIDVHFFPESAMNEEMTKADREAAVAANETPYHVVVANTATRNLSRVLFGIAGDYVIAIEMTSETGVNMNFKGMTLSPCNVATVETAYDFTNLGALLGAAKGNHAYFTNANAQDLLDDGKINYLPYAERPGEGGGGTVFAENGKYGHGIFAQFSGVGGLFALKIASPGVGIYDFNAAINGSATANMTSKGQVYVMPIGDVEDALAAVQETNPDATEGMPSIT